MRVLISYWLKILLLPLLSFSLAYPSFAIARGSINTKPSQTKLEENILCSPRQITLIPGIVYVENSRYCWGLVGNNGNNLDQEYQAGIRFKTISLSWRLMNPAKGVIDQEYLREKQAELSRLYAKNFKVILILGIHDVPAWIHEAYSDSYYVNQYGDRYTDGADAGDVNLVFNPALRDLAANYIHQVFSDFGTAFAAVRLGGGRFGELTYPPSQYGTRNNCYWAFDRNALAQSKVPNWRPGNPSPQGEAQDFLEGYLNALVQFQNWQIETVRASYSGPLMMLYPSWGIRRGDEENAIKVNLNGSTSAEQNGEIQRGYDFARQIAAIQDPKVIVTTTWLDADISGDSKGDIRYWSPIRYLASLAKENPLHLALYGENTGEGSITNMELSSAQMKRYGLVGMAWFNEDELFSGKYATYQDYQRIISRYNMEGSVYFKFMPLIR